VLLTVQQIDHHDFLNSSSDIQYKLLLMQIKSRKLFDSHYLYQKIH